MDYHGLKDLLCASPLPETLRALDDSWPPDLLVSVLDKELEGIKSRLQRVQAYRDSLVSPIHRYLPSELLSRIFYIYAEDSDELYNMRWVLKLSLVCRRWRAIGEDTPILWRSIEITPHILYVFSLNKDSWTQSREVKRIEAQLSRSGVLALSVRMLNLSGSLAQCKGSFSALLERRPAGIVDLTVQLRAREPQAFQNEIHRMLFQEPLGRTMPQLRHLSLSGLPVNWSYINIHELRTLGIDLSEVRFTLSSIGARDMMETISCFTRLENLSLSFPTTFCPIIESGMAISLPHLESLFVEGSVGICIGLLASVNDIPPTSKIAISITEVMNTRASELLPQVKSLIECMQTRAMREDAPIIRTLAITSSYYGNECELRIAGHLDSGRVSGPVEWSKTHPPNALLALCLRFDARWGPFWPVGDARDTALRLWPIGKVTTVDIRRHLAGRIRVDFWRTICHEIHAPTKVIVHAGHDSLGHTLIQHLRAHLQRHSKRVVANIVFDDDGTEPYSPSIRVLLMRTLLYCAEVSRMGDPLDTVEITRLSRGTTAEICFLGHDALNCDCDWSELYKDLRVGFIYGGVLHHAMAG